MDYFDFADWAQDVAYFFPDDEMVTDVNEYKVSTVAYWDRATHTGFISVEDSVIA